MFAVGVGTRPRNPAKRSWLSLQRHTNRSQVHWYRLPILVLIFSNFSLIRWATTLLFLVFSVEFCHTFVSCWFIVLLYYFRHLMFCAFRFHARTIDEYSNCLINAGNGDTVPAFYISIDSDCVIFLSQHAEYLKAAIFYFKWEARRFLLVLIKIPLIDGNILGTSWKQSRLSRTWEAASVPGAGFEMAKTTKIKTIELYK